MYPEQVDMLTDKFAELIPGSGFKVRTYHDSDPAVPEKVEGAIIAQYSPYDHDAGEDKCTPQARVRIFYENQQEAVIDKSWDSQFASGISERCCELPCA